MTAHIEGDLVLQRDNNKFTEQTWDNGKFDIQHWLQRTAWKSLADTDYGLKKYAGKASQAIEEDPLLKTIYKMDIATFLTAEKVSMTNMAKMVSFAPDENSQVFLATQAFDEARHYEVFCRRLADVGMSPVERNDLVKKMTLPKMKAFYDLIDEQVDKEDFISALLAHNVVLEGMAYPLYRYEIKYWSVLDPGLSSIVKRVFADEVQHVSYGEAFIKAAATFRSPDRPKIQRLIKDFHALMVETFLEVIDHTVGLYQEAADMYMDRMGGIEIFPGHRMADVSEEDQVRLLMQDVEKEYVQRLDRLGFDFSA